MTNFFEFSIPSLILLANIINFVGTFQLIRTVIQNKQLLHGYSFSGAILTFITLIIFNSAWALMGEWLSVGLGAVTMAYWLFVVIFKLYYGRKPKVTIKPIGERFS